jgi:hypothetical protein
MDWSVVCEWFQVKGFVQKSKLGKSTVLQTGEV